MEFAPREELRGATGVFAKDDAIKDFLESKSAESVFLRIQLNHMNKYTFDEAAMVGEYARAPFGVTRSAMRFECRPTPEVQEGHSRAAAEDLCPFAD